MCEVSTALCIPVHVTGVIPVHLMQVQYFAIFPNNELDYRSPVFFCLFFLFFSFLAACQQFICKNLALFSFFVFVIGKSFVCNLVQELIYKIVETSFFQKALDGRQTGQFSLSIGRRHFLHKDIVTNSGHGFCF